jgi:hypothetical protein
MGISSDGKQALPKRLHKNHQGYLGETISIAPLTAEILNIAKASGFKVRYLQSQRTIEDPPTFPLELLWLRREVAPDKPWVYISSGVHGDEPAGPLAILEWLKSNQHLDQINLDIFPCLNPRGLESNSRNTPEGFDLNRDYLCRLSNEAKLHTAWFEEECKIDPRRPKYAASICLHEDWEADGFYLYEVNPAKLPSYADTVIQSVEKYFPIDRAEWIDGRPARNGVIRPEDNPALRDEWPEAIYMIAENISLRNFTLETSSDFDLETRALALVKALSSLISCIQIEGQNP